MGEVKLRDSTKEERERAVSKTLDFLEKHRAFVRKTHESVITYAKEHQMPPQDLLLLEETLHQTTVASIHVALEYFFTECKVQWKQKPSKDAKKEEEKGLKFDHYIN